MRPEINEIKVKAITLHYKKDQNIFRQGNEVEGIFCVKSGVIKTIVETKPGETFILNFFKDSSVLGIASLYGTQYLDTSICLTDAEVCFFTKDIILEFAGRHKELQKRILIIRQNAIQNLYSLLGDLHSKSIAQRFISWIRKDAYNWH